MNPRLCRPQHDRCTEQEEEEHRRFRRSEVKRIYKIVGRERKNMMKQKEGSERGFCSTEFCGFHFSLYACLILTARSVSGLRVQCARWPCSSQISLFLLLPLEVSSLQPGAERLPQGTPRDLLSIVLQPQKPVQELVRFLAKPSGVSSQAAHNSRSWCS
jgi:hypothetical protein